MESSPTKKILKPTVACRADLSSKLHETREMNTSERLEAMEVEVVGL
jgi:hypothetical protein